MRQATCQCEIPSNGTEQFCLRHGIYKYRRLVELCNLGARGEEPGVAYWKAWEEGRGLGQTQRERDLRAVLEVLWPMAQAQDPEGLRSRAECLRSLITCTKKCVNFDGDLCLIATEGFECSQIWLEKLLYLDCADYQPRPRPTLELSRREGCGCGKRKMVIPPLKRYKWTRIVSSQMLVEDTASLIPYLPPDIDLVVGIARTGMIPATLIACELHRPLLSVSRRYGVVPTGAGGRLDAYDRQTERNVLLIDDTVCRGRILEEVLPLVEARFPDSRIYKSAIYAPQDRVDRLDICAVEYGLPHYLLYNLFQCPGHAANALFDMDGILCDDFTAAEDDDGERYLKAIERRKPRWLPRYCPIRIVTARLEKYRAPTLAWLTRYGVRPAELVMGPWVNKAERNGQVAAWKAAHYEARPGVNIFIESDPGQSHMIARITRRPVLCPSEPYIVKE